MESNTTYPNINVISAKGETRVVNMNIRADAEDTYIFLEDVTHAAALENQLTKTLNNLEEAQRLAKLGSWEMDLEHGAVTWSKEMEQIYGISEPTAARVKGLIFPEDLPKFEQRIIDAVDGDKVYELEYRITHPSGVVKYICSRAQPIVKNGKVVKRIGTVQDVTERRLIEQSLAEVQRQLADEALKQGEIKLRDQQAFFSAVMNEAPVLMFSKNKLGEYTLANSAVAEHFGVTTLEILGKTDAQLTNEAEATAIREKDLEVLNSRVSRTVFEETTTRSTGEKRTFQTVKTAISLPNGETQVLGVALDITDMIHAEEARRRSEARYKRLFDRSKSGLMLVSYDKGIILDVNNALLALTRLPRHSLIGAYVWKCAPLSSLWPNKESFFGSLNKESSSYELILDSVSKRHIEVVCSVYTENHGQVIQCAIRDISDRARIDAELARLDRLNVVGEMAASIAHEIRNPMTTVRGFLQLLGAKDELGPHQRFIKLMIEELDRANNIISTYLSLARTSIDTVPCDLSFLVKEFAEVLTAGVIMRDRNIRYELASSSKVPVCEAEIKQLLTNLVKNASESMSDGGTVVVSVTETPQDIILSVADEGCGIPKDLLPRLGTPFVTTKDNGVGLGLAICYRIAQRHGAVIDVASSPKGSTFSIRFKKDATPN